jgi:small-conductance mechanosensitive channel
VVRVITTNPPTIGPSINCKELSMSKVSNIEVELADLKLQLQDAELRKHAASLAVANNPADTAARKHAQGAELAIKEIKELIAVLDDAKGAAAEQDASAAAQARLKEAAQHLKHTKAAMAERLVVARKMDATLRTLHDLGVEWAQANAALRGHLSDFYRIALRGKPEHVQTHYRFNCAGVERHMVNAYLAQFDQAATVAGIPPSAKQLTYSGSPLVQESIERDIATASEKVLVQAAAVAEQEGIPIEGAAK